MFAVRKEVSFLQGGKNMDPHQFEANVAIAEIQMFYGDVRFPEERKNVRRLQRKNVDDTKSLQSLELVSAGFHGVVDDFRGVV